MELSSSVLELDGKAHVETVEINTNYEHIKVSGSENWCSYELAEDNKSITVTVKMNEKDARQATITLTGIADEGECTRNIVINQGTAVIQYTLDCSAIDFTESSVVDAVYNGKKMAQICQEYIYSSDKTVDRKTAVLYPFAKDGSLDLNHGIELSTGATVSWETSTAESDSCTCVGGDGKKVSKLYFNEGKVSSESIVDADAEYAMTLSPSILYDIRGMEVNTYKYVKIGTQYWMAENLKAEKYANGKALTENWDSAGSFMYYAFDPEWKEYCGTVYNGYATISENGLAPKGWEIPSIAQWNLLYNYLRNKRGTKVKVAEWINASESAEYANITGMSIDSGFCWIPYGSDTGWNDEVDKTYLWTSDRVEKNGTVEFRYVYFAKSSANINRSISSTLDLTHSLDNGNYLRCVKSIL